MAKSIRSKHKRRMRAIKRVRYGVKELARLKKTLGIVDNEVKTDVEIEGNVIEFVLPEEVKKQNKEKKKKAVEEQVAAGGIAKGETLEEDEAMVEDVEKVLREKGSYPVWMNHRHIRKLAESRKKKKKMGKKRPLKPLKNS